MSKNHKLFLKPLLAAFVLLLSWDPDEVFRLGWMVAAAAFFMSHFFILFQPAFPKKLLRISILLMLAAFFEIANLITRLPPLWIVSLGLLLEWKDFEKNNLGFQPFPLFVRAVIFYGAILFVEAFQLMTAKAGLFFLQKPAGILFLFLVFSWLVLRLQGFLSLVPASSRKGKR